MNETQQNGRTLADGMTAQFLLSQLASGEDPSKRWLDSEMKGVISLFFTPPTKETLRSTAFMVGEPMVDFCKKAVIDRIKTVLNEKVVAMRALDQQTKEAA